MKFLLKSQKLKLVAWKTIAIIAFGYIALMDILLINMFQSHITEEMKRLTDVVWIIFIGGLILRLIKLKKIILPFIIIGDAILIFITILQGGFSANSFWEIFLEPGLLLNILAIITIVMDWRIRYQKN